MITGVEQAGMDSRTWTITELAREFGVTQRTLRFYEEHGLLTPERRGTQRVFHTGDRVRLELVLRGKRLGFPLEEIKKIVGMYDADSGETGQLAYLLEQIAVRRSELEQRRSDIVRTLAELDDLERRCRDDLVRLGSPAADQGVRA
ncbi:MAG TPA: MerR family DNA-binding transcriptional regulator [Jiangellaceae bacterium]|jgi:DNA-binding transcriptional MerR regulator